MKHQGKLTVLVVLITIIAGVASGIGIISSGGPGPYPYESIRGEVVEIYGTGIYRHMSADVAVQGIAQDVITLFIGIPMLWISLFLARSGSLSGRYMLAGTTGYFLVTYLFYLVMGMYNILFLAYASLLGMSFFAFLLTILGFQPEELPGLYKKDSPVRLSGLFLMVNSLAISLLWLGVVLPPLFEGSIYPVQLQHYTTLIVQGLDLGLLLPAGFVAGWLLYRKRPFGFLFGPVYLIFLSILMAALVSKIVAMGMAGQPIFPVIIIMPTIFIISVTCSVWMLRSIRVVSLDHS
jgi:hypothetical protein